MGAAAVAGEERDRIGGAGEGPAFVKLANKSKEAEVEVCAGAGTGWGTGVVGAAGEKSPRRSINVSEPLAALGPAEAVTLSLGMSGPRIDDRGSGVGIDSARRDCIGGGAAGVLAFQRASTKTSRMKRRKPSRSPGAGCE